MNFIWWRLFSVARVNMTIRFDGACREQNEVLAVAPPSRSNSRAGANLRSQATALFCRALPRDAGSATKRWELDKWEVGSALAPKNLTERVWTVLPATHVTASSAPLSLDESSTSSHGLSSLPTALSKARAEVLAPTSQAVQLQPHGLRHRKGRFVVLEPTARVFPWRLLYTSPASFAEGTSPPMSLWKPLKGAFAMSPFADLSAPVRLTRTWGPGELLRAHT